MPDIEQAERDYRAFVARNPRTGRRRSQYPARLFLNEGFANEQLYDSFSYSWNREWREQYRNVHAPTDIREHIGSFYNHRDPDQSVMDMINGWMTDYSIGGDMWEL